MNRVAPPRAVGAPERVGSVPGTKRDARLAWALVAVVATAGVQWFGLLGAGSLALKWFHLAAVALVAVVLLTPDLGARIEVIAHRWGVFWVAYAVYLAAVLSTHVLRHEPFLPLSLFARQVVYGAAGALVAVAALSLVTESARRALSWTALISSAVALVALFEPLVRLGLNPVSLLIDGFLGGRPELVIFGLFRASFASAGGLADEAVRANLRHGLASAMALSLFLTALARADLPRVRRHVADLGMGMAGVIVAITLSRSIILAVIAWLAIVTARPLVRGKASLRRWALPALLAGSVVVLAFSPAGDVFEERFLTDEGSVSARGANLTDALDHADEYLLGADGVEPEASPHNVVLDALLAGGLLGALAALAGFVVLAAALAQLSFHYLTGAASWHVPVSQAATIGIGLIPLARFLTAGGGLLSFGEWAALGVFFALLAANARAARRSRVP